jgi:hypothetical protein
LSTTTSLGLIKPAVDGSDVADLNIFVGNNMDTLNTLLTSVTPLTQLTKLGVVGSTGSPNQTNITIPSTSDFNRPPVEVLKFIPGATNVVSTLMAFNNGDSTSFVADTQLVFDGTMHEKVTYPISMTDGGVMGTGKLWTAVIDKTAYKAIEGIGVT